MAIIKNVSYKVFREAVANKNIVIWGAGKLASYYMRTLCENLNILFLIDKNESLCGKDLIINGVSYTIKCENDFLQELKENPELDKKIAIFISPTSYAGEIIKHINAIPLLNNIDCYAGILVRDFYEKEEFQFSGDIEKIPRKIHYCWFGGKQIPDHLKRYMETWNKFCPDYEIIRWDETNYDVTKNNYMKEAYECKKWGFVPDYARLDIIYNEGGIYLDTDVELLAPLDRLLTDEMFCGFQFNFQINLGCGFGAVKNHFLIKQLRDFYDELSFYLENGDMNLKTCYEYQHPVFQNYGFSLENKFQKKDGIVIYPSEVLAPDNGIVSCNYSESTVAIHRLEYSWANSNEKEAFELFKKEIKYLLNPDLCNLGTKND